MTSSLESIKYCREGNEGLILSLHYLEVHLLSPDTIPRAFGNAYLSA